MADNKRTRKNLIPLIREDHPHEYNGYPFITLLEYKNDSFLTVVDNVTNKMIHAFVLDLCGPAKVDEELIINTIREWYENNDKYPLSFEFSRLGMSEVCSRIYRSFNVDIVSRAIGPLPRFEMSTNPSIKRRKRKPVPAGMEIKKKVLQLDV